jgi:CHASE2 domain-containing sensor protein
LVCCNSSKKNDFTSIDPHFAFVNIGDVERTEIAKAIEIIKGCGAKVIAINVLFESKKTPLEDSLLAKSMKAAGNVILSSGLRSDGHITRSNSMFSDVCLDHGAFEFGFNDDELVDRFKISVLDDHGDLVWTFPFSIAMNYNQQNNLLETTHPDHYYAIKFDASSFDTKVFDIKNLSGVDCNVFRDKIVLVGYFGPRDEEAFFTTLDPKRKMFSTMIFANIISTILKKDFEDAR